MSPSPSTPASPSLKRPRTDENDGAMHSTPTKQPQAQDSPTSSGLSTPMTVQSTRDFAMASTAPAPIPIQLQPASASTIAASQKHTLPASNPPTKRRKITPAEKAQKAAEKEAEKTRKEAEREAEKAKREAEREAEKAKKDAEREAEKAKKEAEREAKKAEAKAKKDEEDLRKAEKAKAREEEKKAAAEAKAAILKAKEEERLKKEEEKLKKEKVCLPCTKYCPAILMLTVIQAQPRLAFFGFKLGNTTPAPLTDGKTLKASASPARHSFMTKDEARRRSMSVSLEPQSPSPSMAPRSSAPEADTNEVEQTKAYKKHFLPFHVLKHTKVAPVTRFSVEQLAESESVLNSYSASDQKSDPSWPEEVHKEKITRGFQAVPVKHLLSQLHCSAKIPVDLTAEVPDQHIDFHCQITMKYFDFSQDVRPPYSGTWTRPQSLYQSRRLARNPFCTFLPEVDYDYDSEAEWDAGDGEDVDSNDEEDLEDDDGEDEMDDFLDDEGAAELAKAKKGILNTDLEPICSGLHWEDADGVLHPAEGNDVIVSFSELKMEFLLGVYILSSSHRIRG
jgi:chromatin assembly factor 1 subunit A